MLKNITLLLLVVNILHSESLLSTRRCVNQTIIIYLQIKRQNSWQKFLINFELQTSFLYFLQKIFLSVFHNILCFEFKSTPPQHNCSDFTFLQQQNLKKKSTKTWTKINLCNSDNQSAKTIETETFKRFFRADMSLIVNLLSLFCCCCCTCIY